MTSKAKNMAMLLWHQINRHPRPQQFTVAYQKRVRQEQEEEQHIVDLVAQDIDDWNKNAGMLRSRTLWILKQVFTQR